MGQGEGEDAVRDGYGVLAGVEDQANLEAVADQVSEPREVLGVGWAGSGACLHFHGDEAAVGAGLTAGGPPRS